MTTREDAAAILSMMQVSGLGPKSLHRLLVFAARAGMTPAELVRLSPQSLQAKFGLKEASAAALSRDNRDSESVRDALEERGVTTVSVTTPDYPQRLLTRLGEDAPAVLFVIGSKRLLSAPSVACVGSRDASARGLCIARAGCGDLARSHVNVVSGHANGVDLASHEGALTLGGTTTIVLAEGILGFRSKGPVGELLSETNSLILSQL